VLIDTRPPKSKNGTIVFSGQPALSPPSLPVSQEPLRRFFTPPIMGGGKAASKTDSIQTVIPTDTPLSPACIIIAVKLLRGGRR